MFKSVGKRVKKYDGEGLVTGKLQYVSDIKMPGMLVCKTLRSPYHRAKLNNVDISEALKVPGVHAVITKDDVPHNRFGMVPDHHLLAEELIRYKGQNIAAVAAVDKKTALEAISKIKLDIEELPFVIDPQEALKPDAPKVRPEGNLHLFDGESEVRKIRKGDIEKGFKEADIIVEGTYTTPSQEHAPLETCASVAYVDESGKLVIHSKTQGLYFTQGDLANAFKLPLNKLKFVGGTIGGAFGAMNSIHTDHIAGILALKTGKPVKFQLTREEEMMYTTIRSPWIFKFKDGVTKDGKITAREIDVLHDCGSFTELGLYAVEKNANMIAGATKIDNLAVNSRMVYTNKMQSGSMRGFGVNVGQFADQVHTEKLAKAVGMHPIEFRLKNSFKENDINHVGNELQAVSAIETLKFVAEMAGEEISEEYK
ncbi:MAG: xanthine dehydrogenase family protein molybdopterin-binding subunit, partial [Tissierellales bacterium]|nr:xanthine dehydrogenase family protein molybdopterin-binding subunit [Tissierellales bacterium]